MLIKGSKLPFLPTAKRTWRGWGREPASLASSLISLKMSFTAALCMSVSWAYSHIWGGFPLPEARWASCVSDLRRALSLVLWSTATTKKFLIIFEIGAWCFLLVWTLQIISWLEDTHLVAWRLFSLLSNEMNHSEVVTRPAVSYGES